jgi:hypothetical protein
VPSAERARPRGTDDSTLLGAQSQKEERHDRGIERVAPRFASSGGDTRDQQVVLEVQ